jgi:hypothetical protein
MEPEFSGMVVLDVEPGAGETEDYAVHVLIAGTNPLPYGKPFLARFDDEPIEELAIDIHGTGITGYLKNEPAEGARLFVEFAGRDPIDTGFTYSRDNGPIS